MSGPVRPTLILISAETRCSRAQDLKLALGSMRLGGTVVKRNPLLGGAGEKLDIA